MSRIVASKSSSCSTLKFSSISSRVLFWCVRSSAASAVDVAFCLVISPRSLKRTSSRFRLLPFLLSLAKSAFRDRPFISNFFKFLRALDAISASLYWQKPKPFGSLVFGSILSLNSWKGPAILKVLYSSSSVALYGMLPKKMHEVSWGTSAFNGER